MSTQALGLRPKWSVARRLRRRAHRGWTPARTTQLGGEFSPLGHEAKCTSSRATSLHDVEQRECHARSARTSATMRPARSKYVEALQGMGLPRPAQRCLPSADEGITAETSTIEARFSCLIAAPRQRLPNRGSGLKHG